jgi:hypothetical protein
MFKLKNNGIIDLDGYIISFFIKLSGRDELRTDVKTFGETCIILGN